MAASLSSNQFARQAVNKQASELSGLAVKKILDALYGGVAEALYREDGVFGDDSEALRGATSAAFESVEDKVQAEFASLYGEAVSRAMLNTKSPAAGGDLYKAFKAANDAYRNLSSSLLNDANRKQRAWLKRRGYQTKRAYLERSLGSPGLHPQGQSNFGVQSGLFARQFRAVEHGGNLRSGVFIGDAEQGKKTVLVRQTVDATRGLQRSFYFGSSGIGKKPLVRELKGRVSGIDLTLSAQTQFPRSADVVTNVQFKRLRRDLRLPYNNERLAEAALGEAIRRAL